MADIAPLGFAVDTKALLDAAAVAQDAAVKITGVADAADKVGEAQDKSTEKVKKATEAHKEHAKAVKETTAASVDLAAKTKDVGAASLQNAKDELVQRARIHDMVSASLAKMQQASGLAQTNVGGGLIPKNQAAQSFERSIEQSAFAKMGPTQADIARQAAATKEAQKFRLEMERMTGVLDPAQAKLLKIDRIVEQLGKQFDAGKISAAEYYAQLDKASALEAKLQAPSTANNGTRRHNSFLGEAGRAFTYGIPRFGREARHLVYSAENEESGGPLAGMIGFGRLAAGAAVGMGAVMAFRYISQLPAEMAKAQDAEQELERRFASFGSTSSEAFDKTSEAMTNLSVSIKAGLTSLMDFHGEFTRLSATVQQQDQAFAAVVAAGRIGGLDEQTRLKSATDVGALVNNKPLISGSDISGLNNANPVLAQSVAQSMGTNVQGLTAMAASGQVSGQRLLDAILKVSGGLQAESSKIAKNSDELNKEITDKMDQGMANIGGGMLKAFRKWVELPMFTAIANATNGTPAPTPPKAPPPSAFDQLAARAATVGEHYGTYQTGRTGMANDLATVNQYIDEGTKRWGSLSDAQRKSVEAAKDWRREIQAGLQEEETPFKRIMDQVTDLTDALGHGQGNSGLIGVWEQALQIQREQQRVGHGLAASLNEIVDALIALKRAQQDVTDTDELKKLQDAIGVDNAVVASLGQGGYAQRFAQFQTQQSQFWRDRVQMGTATGGGMAGSTAPVVSGGTTAAAAAPSGGTSLQAFLGAIRQQESGGRDFNRYGLPLISSQGAMYAMQVLPSTAFAPGHGITPARSMSSSEFDRVGTDLASYYYNRYGVQGAAQAYFGGAGSIGHAGPKGRKYVSDIMARLGMGGGIGTAATISGGTNMGLSGDVYLTRRNAFDSTESRTTENFLAGLIGNPQAFAQGGVVSGGSVGKLTQQVAAYQRGATPNDIHALELEQKIQDAIANNAPGYEAQIRLAMTRQDSAEQTLKAEQQIAQLNQQAADNAKRAGTAITGDPKQMAALELQLKIAEIQRTAPPADQQRLINATNADAVGQSDLATANVVGSAAKENRDLRDQLSLTKYIGDEYDLQNRLLQARRQIEEQSLGLDQSIVDARIAEAEALIKGNDLLEKRLQLVTDMQNDFKYATDTIGAAWSKMFLQFETTGKLHTNILLRGIEDGFYGMLDRIYQRLVISPLMKVLDTLMNSLMNAILPGIGGGGGSVNTGNATMDFFAGSGAFGVGGATGMVMGSNGVMPFARGGIFNTPTRFYAGGGQIGLAGEGPGTYEGILPLTRGPDGKLGVRQRGGGDGGSHTSVVVNDMRGSEAPAVEVQERQVGNGMRQIELSIRDAQRGNVRSGRMDADMSGSYGIRRPAIRR